MRTPRPSRRVAAAPSGSPDAQRTCAHDRVRRTSDIRAWEPRHRSVEVAVLTFRGWPRHVCARCHRNKKNLHAMNLNSSALWPPRQRARIIICNASGDADHSYLTGYCS